jgi:DNA polymerase family B
MISKLLLNSLYGRLGMNPIAEHHLILSYTNKHKDNVIDFYSKNNITNVLDLKNGKVLISYFKNPLPDSNFEEDFDIKNVSIVVASIVTASARIYMSQFKTNKDIILYYSDTDSIDINNKLDPKYVGDELGQMKLEHIFNDAVYLSPKMYGGITDDYEYVRIKGLKNPIKFKELKQLLIKNSKIEIKQEK